MKEFKYVITDPEGIHARPAGEFVKAAASFASDVKITKDGKTLGRAVRTHEAVKPVFVSVGNWIDLDTATALALALTDKDSRIPIPTRYADLETHRQRTACEAGFVRRPAERSHPPPAAALWDGGSRRFVPHL